MPPKAKFSEQQIIEAAVAVTRERGIAAVTAREIAARLGVSTRPLFTYFDSVEELKHAVHHYAADLYQAYIKAGLQKPIPALGVGQQFVRFAKQEPELYKYLFLTPPDGTRGGAMQELRVTQNLVRGSVMRIYHMDADTADKFFRDLWLVAYSMTTLIVTGDCPYSDDEISALFTEFSLSICKAYKEVPGLAQGRYDKDAAFRKLLQKEGTQVPAGSKTSSGGS